MDNDADLSGTNRPLPDNLEAILDTLSEGVALNEIVYEVTVR